MSADNVKVRDRRKSGWFRVDDEIIEVYGPTIGAHGIAVYAALAKYAGKDERSHPGLRTLCSLLRIGKKKLLDTLSLLDELGLIEIESGDRAHVNIYTLLDVPKALGGGSNENQRVVPDRTTGGSNENQGGSEQHQIGGSDQNRNQTHKEPDPLNQSSKAKGDVSIENLPDDETSRCLLLLSRVDNFPRNQADNALYLAELRCEFPDVVASEVCRQYQVWHRDNPGKTKNYRSRLRNFFESAARSKANGRGQSRSSQRSSGRRRSPVASDYDASKY